MDKTKLIIGMVILLSAIGGTYYLASEDIPNLYQCEDMVTLCFKLSKINDAGFQTRCYYNESSPRKYRNCPSGWFKVEYTEITGDEVNLPEREVFILDTEWTNKQDAEEYIEQVKQGLTYEVVRIEITQEPYSDDINVFFLIHVYKGEDRLVRLSSVFTVPETATKEQIQAEINRLAPIMVEEWRPSITISRNDLLS